MDDALSCRPSCSTWRAVDVGMGLPGKARRTLNLVVLFLGYLGNFNREQRRDTPVSPQIHMSEPGPQCDDAETSGMRLGLREVVRTGPHSPGADSLQHPMRHVFSLPDTLVELLMLGRELSSPLSARLPTGASSPLLAKIKASSLAG